MLNWGLAKYLCDPLGALLTKLSWVAKVLHQVRQQTQHIQRETCTGRKGLNFQHNQT